MQKSLFFGHSNEKKTPPWSEGFEMKADGSLTVSISALNKFEIKDGEDINWSHLLNSQINNLATPEEISKVQINTYGEDHFAVYQTFISRLWDKLEKYCNQKSKAERDFFNLYCQLCCTNSITGGYGLPALIPHVYINWIFSGKDRQNNHNQPYIVDFIFKSSKFGTNNLVIVEIDGISHYANYNNLNNAYTISEEVYAEHLKKDRWLRNKGFKVFRIGNSEIKSIVSLPKEEQLMAFYYFFEEIFGREVSVYFSNEGY